MAQPHMAAAQAVQQPTQTYLRDQRPTNITQKDHEILIRYIIDYCDKRGYKETSTQLRRESKLNDNQKPPVDSPEGLLYEWWTCFWQIYTARVHPEKSTNLIAKDYAQKLQHIQARASHDQGQMGPGPTPRLMGGPPRPYINGTGPHPPNVINGHGSTFPNTAPGINGVPPANAAGGSGTNPTALQNPHLQHLGPSRPGQARPHPGPGMQGVPPGAQFAYPSQGRMPPNAGPYPPNARPGPSGQSGSPQMADSQMATASSSPQQSSGTNLADIHPQQLQEYLSMVHYPPTADVQTLPEDIKQRIRELHDSNGRARNARGTKRPSPGGEESLPKEESPSERKKQRLSSQEPATALPSTPSMTPAQPPIGARPPPSTIGQSKVPPHPQVLYPIGHPLNAPPGSLGTMGADALQAPEFAGQMAQLREIQAQTQRLQNAAPPSSQQANQQYFASIQHQTFVGYKPTHNGMLPPPPQNLVADPAAPFARQPLGATSAPKRAMLPPPPPNNPPVPSPGGQMPVGKGTPIMSGAVPRGLPGSKDDSSPSGIDAFSPENTRPASRPIPGSTPQAIPSAPTPTASAAGPTPVPGAPSGMSVPSPSQLATPQQSSRPQSQSPSATATARPSTATLNGTPTLNPTSMLGRAYPGPPPGPGSMLGGGPGNPTLTPGLLAGGSGPSGGMDSQSNDIFNMGLGMPFPTFDMQMMNFQEDTFPAFDLGLGEEYNMYINDPGDSVTG